MQERRQAVLPKTRVRGDIIKNRTRTNLVTDAFVYSGIYTRRGVFWPLGQHILLTLLFMLISAGFPASS